MTHKASAPTVQVESLRIAHAAGFTFFSGEQHLAVLVGGDVYDLVTWEHRPTTASEFARAVIRWVRQHERTMLPEGHVAEVVSIFTGKSVAS